MKVQLNASSSAPVTQAPLTAHTTGVVTARSAAPGFAAAPLPWPVPAATSLKSTPALNTGSIAVTITARVRSSASACATSSQKRARMAAVNAFLTSGRLMVIVRTPSTSSTSSSSVGSAVSANAALLRDAEPLQAERGDGVAAEELVGLLVVQTGLVADVLDHLLRVWERRVGVRIVGLEADLVHADPVAVGESELVVERAPVE